MAGAYLWAWDDTNNEWVRVVATAEGYLQVEYTNDPTARCYGYDSSYEQWVKMLTDPTGYLKVAQAYEFFVKNRLNEAGTSHWVHAVCDPNGDQYIVSRNQLPTGGTPAGAVLVRNTDWVENGTTTLYTVPAGKTFYLVNIILIGYSTVSGATNVMSKLYSSGDIKLSQLMSARLNQDESINNPISFPAFYQMEEGAYITLESDAAGVYIQGSLFGYEL